MKKSLNFSKRNGFILLIIGIILIIVSVYFLIRTVNFVNNSIESNGVVVDVGKEMCLGGEGICYNPVIQFRDFNNNLVSAKVNEGNSFDILNTYSEGDTIHILYLKSNNQIIKINSFFHIW